MPDPAILFDKVTRRFGRTLAVDDLSLEVGRGEMFGLIGPDGAGKTTTIRLACGLTRADAGRVTTLGVDPIAGHTALTRRAGYLSQRFSLYGDLSVDENIAFFAEIHGVAGYHGRRDRLLEMTGLAPFRRRPAERLSGGMKQKLALACTLVHQPQLVLLDEPTTGVDPVSRREFWKLLSEFLAEGITIVMATPYLDEAERCSRVALLSGGRLLALDTPQALRASLPGVIVEVTARPQRPAIDLLRLVEGVAEVQNFGERIHVRCLEGGGHAAARVEGELRRHGIEVAGARPVPASLEDVFIARVAA
jgi:ABC-2 type transport system ATP-binding protein